MAHHKDAIKRIRTSRAANARNRADRSRLRNKVKAVREAIESGNKAEAEAALPSTVSVLHKLARKGIIHRRNASRRVSRLTKAIKKIG